MSKVIIVGDTHFSPRTPVSRKDDYQQTLFNKLTSLLNLCISNQVSDVIFLGDLVNTSQVTLPYLFKLIQSFQLFQQNNIKLHSITGNHDLPHNNPEKLSTTPIGLLYQIKLVDLNSFTLGDKTFNMFHYFTPTDQIPEAKDKNQILIGHYFYQVGFNDTSHTITVDQATKLHYHKYFLGHDHAPYKVIHNDMFEVHRPGSFTRASSDTSQTRRETIQVCLYDTETDKVDYLDVPNILSPDEVYFSTKLIKTEKLDLQDLMNDFDNLINNINYSDSQELFAILDTLTLEPDLKEIILQYLHQEGIYNTNS